MRLHLNKFFGKSPKKQLFSKIIKINELVQLVCQTIEVKKGKGGR